MALNMGQLLSIPFVLAGFALIIVKKGKPQASYVEPVTD
jgi:prolipoprotein diacylglyceryltransferase